MALRTANQCLQRINELCSDRTLRIMNVCGGHERSITQAGLRAALPDTLELIPGPGCPVCVCPEDDIEQAIDLALTNQAILVAFGDMLRVPINGPKSEPRSLEEARATGADVRSVASPWDAARIAQKNPDRCVIFFAAGFETTMAPVAALIAAGPPENLLFLLSGRRTWPAVAMLLETGRARFDALIAPGHVATIMGVNEWAFVPAQYNVPTAVAGFHTESLLAAIEAVLTQTAAGIRRLDNTYPEVAQANGNTRARTCLETVMQTVDAKWRGIGTIEKSGFELAPEFRHLRAAPSKATLQRTRTTAREMPPGCECASVVLGQRYPNECPLYGKGCTPASPIGPCMVSDEGACRIWWSGGQRSRLRRKSPHQHTA
tara:strand:- start:545 stop:1669 length:1125 start_codon:yes stop_codon:yes gene_type:complete